MSIFLLGAIGLGIWGLIVRNKDKVKSKNILLGSVCLFIAYLISLGLGSLITQHQLAGAEATGSSMLWIWFIPMTIFLICAIATILSLALQTKWETKRWPLINVPIVQVHILSIAGVFAFLAFVSLGLSGSLDKDKIASDATATNETKAISTANTAVKAEADAKATEDAKAKADQDAKDKATVEATKVEAAAKAKADADAKKAAAAEAKKIEDNKTMTKAEFDQLKTGMTYDEATKIIGGPGEVLSESGTQGGKGLDIHTVMYQYKGEGSLGANANLMFQNEKLMNKAQMGLK